VESWARVGQTFVPQALPEAVQHWLQAEAAVVRQAVPS
jgi:hypothetical protein